MAAPGHSHPSRWRPSWKPRYTGRQVWNRAASHLTGGSCVGEQPGDEVAKVSPGMDHVFALMQQRPEVVATVLVMDQRVWPRSPQSQLRSARLRAKRWPLPEDRQLAAALRL